MCDVPRLVARRCSLVRPHVHRTLSFRRVFSLRRVVVAKYNSSVTTTVTIGRTFRRLAGVPVRILPTVSITHFCPTGHYNNTPGSPLIVAIDGSNGISHIGRTVVQVGRLNTLALNVASNGAAPLNRIYRGIVSDDVPGFRDTPNMHNFLTSFRTLLLLTVHVNRIGNHCAVSRTGTCHVSIGRDTRGLTATLPTVSRGICDVTRR